MSKPIIKIINLETNEEIEREMNIAEFKEYEARQKKEADIKAEAEAKATAKSDLLTKLGITAEEAALLLS